MSLPLGVTTPKEHVSTYIIRTTCMGSYHQTTINKTEEEAIALFMEQFGEEPNEFHVLYSNNGVFDPKDIQGRCQIVTCDCGY